MTQSEFVQLLERAASCFTPDALYTEPPYRQFYAGWEALYRFFGGPDGRPRQMNMVWHHVVFDPAQQLGAGEFTFSYGETVHGVTMIKVRDGLISNWREYWYASPLSWDAFTEKNSF